MARARWNGVLSVLTVVVLAAALAPESGQAGFFSFSYSYPGYVWPYWSYTYFSYWSYTDFSWLIVDSFTAVQPAMTINTQAQLSSIVRDGSILGGERDVSLIGALVNGQAQPRYARVSNTGSSWSSYGWSSSVECLEYYSGTFGHDSTYPATVVVQWDGTDGVTQLDTTGLDQVDLTDEGAYAFVLSGEGLYTGHYVEGEIRVYSYGSDAKDFCSCRVAFTPGPDATYSRYSSCNMVNGGCEMDSVGALELWVENTYSSFEICQLGTYAGADASPLPTPSVRRSPPRSSTPTRSRTASRTPSPVAFLAPSQNVTVDGNFQFQTGYVSRPAYSSMYFAASPFNSPVCMYTSYETKPTTLSYDYSACAGSGQVAEITYSGSDFLNGWYYGLLISNGTTQVQLQWQIQ